MAVYTELSKEQVEEILLAYNLGKLWNYRAIQAGVANSVYSLVTTKGEYILTLFDQKEAIEVRQQAILMDQLLTSGIPIPEVIATKSGSPLVFFKDKPVLIRGYIEGETCKKPNLNNLYSLGTILGKIHTTPVPKSMTHKIPFNPNSFLDLRKSNQYFGNWILDKTKLLKRLIPEKAPKGVIHGDLFPDNYLVNHGEIVGIIDLEETCNFFLAYDIAITLIGNTRSGSNFDIEKVHHFLKGYEKVRKINSLEKDNFHYFLTYSATVGAFWRYKQFNMIHPNENLKDSYLELMEVANKFEGKYSIEYVKEFFNY